MDAAERVLGEDIGMAVDDVDSAGEETPLTGGDADLGGVDQSTESSDGRAGEDKESGALEDQAEEDPWAGYQPPDRTPPAWLDSWGPRSWMNAKAKLADLRSVGAEEWGYYTDAQVTGFSTHELDPYRLLDAMSFGGDESHLRIMCRSENYLGVFDREIDWTGADDTTWLGMDTGEEYAALLSLATGRRIRSGGLTRTFRADDRDPRGFPDWSWHRARTAPTATRDRNRLLPNAGDPIDLQEAVDLLALYPHLTGKRAVELVRAARQYQLGLWVAEEDPELAWLRLVSAAEAMAAESKPKKISHVERLREYHPQLYQAVEPAGEEVLKAAAAAIAGHLGVTHRFVRFIADRIPEPPARRPDLHLRIEWAPGPIAELLKVVYDHRSSALHGGKPVPGPLLSQRENVETAAPPERFEASMGVGNSNWTVEQLPMTLHAFEYLVRSALQARWRELAKK
ncbi:hypothetical protein ABZ744_20530 [Micromonospora chersina]|uniref:hypothetical protein n=1 Tax=Micromonospora chersina TaxID=47854 RepID=UPI0034062128